MPRQGGFGRDFFPDLESKAAVLLYTLAKSQACVDGNKRLAVIILETFLGINDATMAVDQNELFERVLGVAESDRHDRQRILSGLVDWFRGIVVSLDTEE